MSKEQSALLLLSLSIGLALAVDICEYQMNGAHLSHPADCNKFVECQSGKTYRILNCPLGLHFNRFEGVCDLRQRAACDIGFVYSASEETNCSACCALYGCFVNPECPETPGTPTTPVFPDTPITPKTPSSPDNPETPGTPNTPATPEIPDTPSTPISPGTPATPSTPNTPNTPVTPSSPATPDTPSTPKTPSTPNTPNTPVTPSSPATPDTPSTPKTPSTPNTPNTPVTPTSTATPDIPSTPETPGTPNTPNTPVTPVSPDTPTPSSPDTPATPKTSQCHNNVTFCQGEPDNSVAHVNGTCNQYIVCVAGCSYIMDCPAGLQYDLGKRQCDYPQNVNCPWQSTPPITGPSGVTCARHGQCAGKPDGSLFSSSKSSGYIICQCQCEIERPCPEGTKFDEKLLTCAWQTSVSVNESNYKNYGKERKLNYYITK